MSPWKGRCLTAIGGILICLLGSPGGDAPALAQATPAAVPAEREINGAVVRRVVMKDALSAEQFRARLEALKSSGLFRDQLPGFDPKKPVPIEISFLTSGNYLLVIGSKDWVDANIESIRLMGFLFERPRAHLQLNLRVVQITGPANPEVIQMSETVRALVDAQRDEIVRTFADLGEDLVRRFQQRSPSDRAVFDAARELLPTLGSGERPLTVPETLLLLMLDRSSPAPARVAEDGPADDAQALMLWLPRRLTQALQDPNTDEVAFAQEIEDDIVAWKNAVRAARDWCGHYAEELRRGKDGSGVGLFREALQHPQTAIPSWLARRLLRSLELTERLYPNLVRRHTEESLRELQRRFTAYLTRADEIHRNLSRALAASDRGPGRARPAAQKEAAAPASPREADANRSRIARSLLALKTLAEELVPAPLALFDAVALAADNSAPTPQQLVSMFREYAAERRKLEQRLRLPAAPASDAINYSRLQTLEATLNLWLRRVSEAMARSLEQHFYRRYTNELRLLANKQLGRSSARDLLEESTLDEVADVARDVLLADTGVNIFVSNSISLQFAPDTMNSVSAQVQAALPSRQGLLERVQQAEQATRSLNALSQAFGIDGEEIVKALLAGGQAVPVQGGITLAATPSIGFDGGTVTLSLTANQTLQPNSDKVADRVTNHSINNATVTALSYEPMVLSTLASNISYYESTGGIPILRKTPVLKDLVGDVPVPPFRQGKRQKGIYQSSVLILEPVVIPTVEDLVRFHAGWRETPPTTLAGLAEAMGGR